VTNPAGAAVAAPFSTASSSVVHSALSGVLFLAAFVASCGLLRRFLPFPGLPAVFDRVAGESGGRVKSFYAGVAGMGSPEDAYLFDAELAKEGPKTP